MWQCATHVTCLQPRGALGLESAEFPPLDWWGSGLVFRTGFNWCVGYMFKLAGTPGRRCSRKVHTRGRIVGKGIGGNSME